MRYQAIVPWLRAPIPPGESAGWSASSEFAIGAAQSPITGVRLGNVGSDSLEKTGPSWSDHRSTVIPAVPISQPLNPRLPTTLVSSTSYCQAVVVFPLAMVVSLSG